MYIDNARFLRDLARATGALAVSAVILCTLFIVYNLARIPDGTNKSDDRPVAVNQLKTVFGKSQVQGGGLRITAADIKTSGYHALVNNKVKPFRANDYPVLQYHLEGLNTGLDVNFIWRQQKNGRLHTTPLNRNLNSVSLVDLSSEAGWQGMITEIGFHIMGDLRDTPVTLSQVTFRPHNWQARLGAVWSGWTAFDGWSQKSINMLYGTPNTEGLSPTLVMAAWAGFALALLSLLALVRKERPVISYGLVLLIPWVALDLLWQHELGVQFDETQYQFADKSTHEKHLADFDAKIYQYTNRIKSSVLPPGNNRIFILRDSQGHDYGRLKTQYYLLPNNVYNYGSVPPSEGVRHGDFILALGSLPGLEYHDGYLKWEGNQHLRADLVDEDTPGSLYRVAPRETEENRPVSRVQRSGNG